MQPLPHWRPKLASLLSRTPPPRPAHFWAQLSTIRSARRPSLAGRPAVRTVNLRGLTAAAALSPAVPSSALITFITDARSDKAADIALAPAGEVVLFFPAPVAQIRLSGTLVVLPATHAVARATWRSLDAKERRYFAWPPPGAPRLHAPASEADVAAFHVAVPGADEAPPDSFVVCQLSVDYAECLDLAVDPPVRDIEVLHAGAWAVSHINP